MNSPPVRRLYPSILCCIGVSLFLWNNRLTWREGMSPERFVSVRDLLVGVGMPLALLAMMTGVILSLGTRILRFWVSSSALDPAVRLVLSWAAGAAGLATFHICMGAIGTLKPAFLIVGYGLLGLSGIGPLQQLGRDLRASLHDAYHSEWRLSHLLFLSLIVWGLGNTLLQSLTPPIEIDTLAHHFAHLRLWGEAGRFYALPWLMHANWPMLGEMMFLGPIALGQDTVAQGLHWLFGGAVALSPVAFGAGRFPLHVRLGAAALYVSCPIVTHYLGTGHNDQIWAFYLISAFFMLGRPEQGAAVVAGLLAGAGASCRYHAMYAAGCLFVVALWMPSWFGRSRREVVHAVVLAAAVVSPWWIKNALVMGNPVWPLLYPIFGGHHWSSHLMQEYIRQCWRNPDPRLWLTRQDWLHLWRPTIAPHAAHYFLFPLAVVMPFIRTQSLNVWKAGALWYVLYCPAALIFETNWFRFSMPWLAIGALYVLWAGHHVWSQSSRHSVRRTAIVLLVSLAYVPASVIRFYEPATTLLGLRDSRQPDLSAHEMYLQREIPALLAFRLAERETSPRDRILLFREIRGYYLRREYRWGDPLNQGTLPYETLNTPEVLYSALKQQGITHVLDFPDAPIVSRSTGLSYYTPEILERMQTVLQQHGRIVGQAGGGVLWSLS